MSTRRKIDKPSQGGIPLTAVLNGIVNLEELGINIGEVNCTASGGVLPYTYQLDLGLIDAESHKTGISAGAHTLTVRSSDAQEVILDFVLTAVHEALSISLLNKVDVLCNGSSTGSVTLASAGGVGTHQYKRDAGLLQASPLFEGLAAGTYSFSVYDSNGCSKFLNVTVNQPNQMVVSVESKTDVICKGSGTGIINLSVVGGVVPYEYKLSATEKINQGLWYNAGYWTSIGAGWSQSVNTLVNNGGSGSLYKSGVFDIGVKHVVSIDIIRNAGSLYPPYDGGAPLPALVSVSGMNVREYLPNDAKMYIGSVAFNGEITKLSVKKLIKDGYRETYQASNIFNSLYAGTFTAYVKDVNGCIAYCPVVITEPASILTISKTNQTNVICKGTATGSVTVTGAGGTPAYQYKVDNGAWQDSGLFINLSAGNHTFYVRDCGGVVNGCLKTLVVEVLEPAVILSVGHAHTDVTVSGSDGTITLTGAGGSGGYNYKVDAGNWQVSGLFEGIGVGNHTVYVRDSSSCQASVANVYVDGPASEISTTLVDQVDIAHEDNIEFTGSVTSNAPWSVGKNELVPTDSRVIPNNGPAGVTNVVVHVERPASNDNNQVQFEFYTNDMTAQVNVTYDMVSVP